MWSSRLFWKIFCAYLVLLILLTVGFVSLVTSWQHEAMLGEVQRRLHDAAVLLAAVVEPEWQEGSLDELAVLTRRLGKQTGLRLNVIDYDGRVLTDSHFDPSGLENHKLRPELVEASQNPQGIGLNLRYAPGATAPTQYFAVFVRGPDKPLGYVRASIVLSDAYERMTRTQYWLWSIAVCAAVVVLGVTYVIVGRIVEPLMRLIEGAKAITAGQYDQQVVVAGRDEIGLLGMAFNRMSREMVRQIDELRKHGEQLGTVLGSMIEGVIAVDADEKILFANGAAATQLEFAISRCLGRPLWEVVRNPVVQRAVRDAFANPEPKRSEFEISRTRRMVAMHATRLPGSPCPGVVLVMHDVTDLRRLENLRQEFVANVSHELKTPLTSIKAYTETLLGGAISDPEHNVVFLRRIEEQAERLHQLILDVLSLARIESNAEHIQIESLPLPDIVAQCVEEHLTAADAKDVELRAELGDPLVVLAEEEGLRTILDNLVNNALKYTPNHGQVTVRCRTEDRMALIEVVDTGIGIAPEHQARIFERFYRADLARSRELGGTGLGLSIVKHLVQAFGGSVAVTSQVGHGSTFSIRLPLA